MNKRRFIEYEANEYENLRYIILYGRNSASYKFALGKSLFDLAIQGEEVVSIEKLAVPFSKHVCEHLKHSPKQVTKGKGPFLKACEDFNNGLISKEKLLEKTVRNAFGDVIKRFHTVERTATPISFFKDETKEGKSGNIIISPETFKIAHESAFDLTEEIESRWRLVETAWNLGINASLIRYDSDRSLLLTQESRQPVTGVRSALNGYQKGRCFYCRVEINLTPGSEAYAEVDHLLPFVLQKRGLIKNIDAVWNLVLACKSCNRGLSGKFDAIPSIEYLENLEQRNEYLIKSHHPLRETLRGQMGDTEEKRHKFLQANLMEAQRAKPGSTWKPSGF